MNIIKVKGIEMFLLGKKLKHMNGLTSGYACSSSNH